MEASLPFDNMICFVDKVAVKFLGIREQISQHHIFEPLRHMYGAVRNTYIRRLSTYAYKLHQDTAIQRIRTNYMTPRDLESDMKRRTQHRDRIDTKRHKKVENPVRFEGSHEEVLLEDIRQLILSTDATNSSEVDAEISKPRQLPEKFSEVDIRISELSSTGDAIGFTSSRDHAFVVPFALPGELVTAKVIRSDAKNNYSVTDFLKVIEPSQRRDDELVRCRYFAKCSGCQFQMIPYADQLEHKKNIIKKAYKNFSSLSPEAVPVIGDTTGSPLEYGYRTKLTPHFDGPPGTGFRNKKKETFKKMPPFGYMQKNTRWTIDIEECPIGTDAVLTGLKNERERLSQGFGSYHRGATVLLRESTERRSLPGGNESSEGKSAYEDVKTCITDSNATSTEYVDSYIFKNPAGSFFQNNNSILPVFTQYIRDQINQDNTSFQDSTVKPLKHLIDAYCGSGLFTVTLSSIFKSSLGIDISEASIEYARKNAKLNNVENAEFFAATASDIFKSVSFNPEETVVVIDPPRKGCDNDFLEQLLRFGPRRVAYVSCNVHTQARDIGQLVNGIEKYSTRYKLDSIRGFDFFPQTGHVESVAFLTRQDPERNIEES